MKERDLAWPRPHAIWARFVAALWEICIFFLNCFVKIWAKSVGRTPSFFFINKDFDCAYNSKIKRVLNSFWQQTRYELLIELFSCDSNLFWWSNSMKGNVSPVLRMIQPVRCIVFHLCCSYFWNSLFTSWINLCKYCGWNKFVQNLKCVINARCECKEFY